MGFGRNEAYQWADFDDFYLANPSQSPGDPDALTSRRSDGTQSFRNGFGSTVFRYTRPAPHTSYAPATRPMTHRRALSCTRTSHAGCAISGWTASGWTVSRMSPIGISSVHTNSVPAIFLKSVGWRRASQGGRRCALPGCGRGVVASLRASHAAPSRRPLERRFPRARPGRHSRSEQRWGEFRIYRPQCHRPSKSRL